MRLRTILGVAGLIGLSALSADAKDLPSKGKDISRYQPAQTSTDFVPYNQVSLGLSLFKGSQPNFNEIYGTSNKMFSGAFARTFKRNLRAELSLNYAANTGTPLTRGNMSSSGCNFKRLEIDGSLYFLIPIEKGNFYIAAGPTRISFSETMDFSTGYAYGIASLNESNFGYHFLGGMEAFLFSESTGLFFQIRKSSAKLTMGSEIGGISVGGGVRFRF